MVFKMVDIFDAKISCRKCGCEMEKSRVRKGGFDLRAVVCPDCGDKIIHPADLHSLEQFRDLKGKTFRVKLRMVGNSHAVSIPKEIVNFFSEVQKSLKKDMDDMVNLCFEDFGKLSLVFDDFYNSKTYMVRSQNNLNREKQKEL